MAQNSTNWKKIRCPFSRDRIAPGGGGLSVVWPIGSYTTFHNAAIGSCFFFFGLADEDRL